MPLARGLYAPTNPEALRNGLPVLALRESVSRRDLTTDVAAALTTQIMTAVAVPLQAGDVITKLGTVSGATAAVTPTNYWFALYDSSAVPALLGQTPDQLAAAWGADTVKDIAIGTSISITQTGIYYVAIMVKAATVPSLLASVLPRAAASGGIVTGQKALAVTSGAALTTTAPATLAAPANSPNLVYAFAH